MSEQSLRHTRMQERMFEEISAFVPLEMRDPRVTGCRVTRVVLAPDLQACRVFFVDSERDDGGRVSLAALNHAAAYIGARLAEYLSMRHPPKIQFSFDHNHEKAERLESLFSAISEREKGGEDGGVGGVSDE